MSRWHIVRIVSICIRCVDRDVAWYMRAHGPNVLFGVFIMVQSIASKLVRRFIRDERGATMVEYGLLVALVAVAVIGAVTTLGGSITSFFESADTGLNGG